MSEHCHCHCHEEESHNPLNRYEEAFGKYNCHLHDEEVHATVTRLLESKKAQYNTPEVLQELLSTIELTTLTVTDSKESVMRFTEKVNAFAEAHPELPHIATICVYPNYASTVSETLEVEGVEVACVSGGFPSSQTFQEIKVAETALALHEGATEIDMVLSVGAFLEGDYETCADEIAEMKQVCGDYDLKVILETGALQTAENIKRASILSIYAGADFIKTSTGKISVSATPEAAYVMCQTIKEYYKETGIKIGFKAAGGVSTVDDALTYYTIVRELLGKEWIDENLFRIGTSRLANLLVQAITGTDEKPF